MARTAACLLAATIALGGCASLPQDDGRPVSDAEGRTTAAAPSAAGVVVCELVGRDSIIQVLAGSTGTRYTLCSMDGTPIAAHMDAAGLARLRPDLDPKSMQADWGRGGLMMVDTKD